MIQSFYTQSKVVVIPSELGWIDLYEQSLKINFSFGSSSTIKKLIRKLVTIIKNITGFNIKRYVGNDITQNVTVFLIR